MLDIQTFTSKFNETGQSFPFLLPRKRCNSTEKRPFLSCSTPLFESKAKCKDDFHSHANKTHFHKKGFALIDNLKVRIFGTPKWSIAFKC